MKVIKLVMPLTETLPKDGLIPPKTQPSSPIKRPSAPLQRRGRAFFYS